MRTDCRYRRPLLERLEDRCVPAFLAWLGAASTDWADGLNWSGGAPPGATDDVIILAGANAPTISSGSYSVRSLVGPGSLTVQGGGELDVAGISSLASVTVAGGSLTFDSSAHIGSLTVSGGTLEADGLDVYTAFAWSGGTLAGDGAAVLHGTSTLSGGNKTLDGLTLRNEGGMTWSSGRVEGEGGADIQNAGLFTVTTASTRLEPAFTNTGSFVFDTSAEVDFGKFTNAGAVALKAGTFDPSSLVQTAGSLGMAGGTLGGSVSKKLQGGTMTGGGQVEGSLTNSGATIILGVGQTLTVDNNYTQSGTGVLRVSVNTGGPLGRLAVGGRATLGGSLDVRMTGSAPASTTLYSVLAANTRSGLFSSITITPVSKATTSTLYASQSVSVRVTPVAAAAPTPTPTPLPLPTPTPTPTTPVVGAVTPTTQGGTTTTTTTDTSGPTTGGPTRGGTSGVASAGAALATAAGLVAPQAGPGVAPQAPADAGAVVATAPSGRRAVADLALAVTAEQAGEVDGVILAAAPLLPALPAADGPDARALVASMLFDWRASGRLSSQAGASLSPVATFSAGDDVAEARQDLADRALAALMLSPAGGLGDWEGEPAESIAEWTPEADQPEGPSAMASFWGAAVPPALMTVAALAALAGIHSRAPRRP